MGKGNFLTRFKAWLAHALTKDSDSALAFLVEIEPKLSDGDLKLAISLLQEAVKTRERQHDRILAEMVGAYFTGQVLTNLGFKRVHDAKA